jgi:hypothetical protein
MRIKLPVLLTIAVFALECGAQSLPEVARQERRRQRQIVSKYVFTNADMTLAPVAGTPPPEARPAVAGKETDASAPEGRTEAEWRAEFARVRSDVPRAEERVALLQLQLNELNRQLLNQGDMYNREGQLVPQIQAATEDLESARMQVTTAEQTVVDLQDELRRSGAPVGWGRPQ